ncbi:MAG: Thioredoxin 2 [Candidatus Erwinia impunctatus]
MWALQSQLFNGEVINATTQSLDAYLQDDLPVIIDFWAPWCVPCVNFSPVYSDVAAERCSEMRFIKVNTESEPALSQRFRIRSIPTLLFFQSGNMVDQLNGALPKAAFIEWLDENLTQ